MKKNYDLAKEWADMYLKGAKQQDIADKYMVHRETVAKHIKPLVKMRSRHDPNTDDVFWDNIQPAQNGCIEWVGKKNNKGYGTFSIASKKWMAHRFSYHLSIGDCAGVFICHKCDNPLCVNPEHLFAGTHSDNMADMAKKLRSGLIKLTPEDVTSIRRLLNEGLRPSEISKMFNTSDRNVRSIRAGTVWRWLK